MRRRSLLSAGLAGVVLGVGVAGALLGGIATPMPPSSSAVDLVATRVPPSPAPGYCRAHGGLPDRSCTPGATNPDVTPETIGKTICQRGWAARIRPAVAVTAAIKRERMAAYGVGDQDPRVYELDHLIPLELGGHPDAVENLWPEAGVPRPGFHEKDAYETHLRREVCAGRLALVEAQRRIATDWIAGWATAGSQQQP